MDGIDRHEMRHVIQGATWMIGITAGAMAPMLEMGAPVARRVGAGKTPVAAAVAPPTARGIVVIARCEARALLCERIGMHRRVDEVALVALAILALHAGRHRAGDSGAMNHGDGLQSVIHVIHAPREVAEGPWRRSQRRASSPWRRVQAS